MAEDTPDDIADGQAAGPAPPDQVAGGERVEVHHKHHPIHGWREFLKEIAIIVLGVLIALAAEQTVEAIHRHHQVDEARRTLRTELSYNFGVMQWRWRLAACSKDRLDELDGWWRAWRTGEKVSITGPITAPPHLIVRRSVWTVAIGGVVAQMPFDERVAYSHFYDALANAESIRSDEEAHWAELSPLQWSQKAPSADQLVRIKTDIEALRALDLRTLTNAVTIKAVAREMSITEADGARAVDSYLRRSKPFRDATQQFCRPSLPSR